MTRLRIAQEDAIFRIPDGWDYWTYGRRRYRRHEGVIQERWAGHWRRVHDCRPTDSGMQWIGTWDGKAGAA